MARVTVVNDSPEFLELMEDILEDDRYQTTTIDGDLHDAVQRIRDSRPELLIIDIRLGAVGDHGWEIAQQVRADPGLDGLPILLCSGDPFAIQELAEDIERAQPVGTLAKPFSVDQLFEEVERLLGGAAARKA